MKPAKFQMPRRNRNCALVAGHPVAFHSLLRLRILLVLLAGIVGSTVAQAQTPAALIYDPGVGSISFAASDLKAALEQNGYAVTNLPLGDPSTATPAVRIILTTSGVAVAGQPVITGMTNQGYAIQRVVDGAATNWWVIGHDAPGAMYGGLELAEAVKLADGLAGVTNRQTNPYVANRGIKFNIPLDVRTPSYSDDSSSAQPNIAQMWETNFWTGMLDNMARHRYNLLSLWSLHPFPSLVRVPEYPNVALADVKQKSGALWDATLVGTGMYDSSWTLTTLKTMTMDEKIAFWRWVMQYAKDRGIDLYVFTWNIFTYGTEPSGYGITDRSTNAITTDYFRKSVRTLFNTYPLLAGVGLTVGENMGGISSAAEEQWAWDTYGLGVSDAIADAENPASPYYAPGRVIRLVHRAHQADLNQIISYFSALPGATNADSTLSFSFKYSQAHMHSSTKPQFIYNNNWFNTIPAGKKIFLTVRNDDMYYMRWGDPDFARAYMTNLPDLSKIAGFYMGPDGYTWGREFLSTEPDSPRQLVIEKMWYSFLLYGRLAYEPTLPNSRFEGLVAERFPEVASSNLFSGWTSVSKILPLLTRFYWGALDFQWYPEACWSSSGFKTVQSFIDPQWDPMQSSEDGDRPLLMSVKQYVNGDAANGRLNPLEVANLLQQYADAGLASVVGLSPGSNKELRLTLGDIEAMAWLGRYYAEKIRGAVDLYRYQTNGLVSDQANARAHLITASNHWSQYSARWTNQYVSQVLTRMGLTAVDIAGIQAKVNADIPVVVYTLSTSATNGTFTLNPPGGVYSSGTVVTVTATGNLGYGFSSWGGDLAGSNSNPTTILMNANKSVSASFVPVPIYTLTTSATNGAILLTPPGGIYSSGTVVTVTASPNNGYAFTNWGGDLSGTVNPTPITMTGNKSVTANFAVFFGEAVPWTETFTLADGVKSHGWPSSWFVTPGTGNFRVLANELAFNDATVEGVFTSGLIKIAGPVTVSLGVRGGSGLDAGQDYLRFYKKVDGGAEVLIAAADGPQAAATWTSNITSGSNLVLVVRAKVSTTAEYYYFDNLKVEYDAPLPTFILTTSATNGSIALNPPGGIYTTGTVVTVTANANVGYAFSNWSGALSGSVNPTNITMNGNKSVTANFGSAVTYTLTTSATNGSISLNPPGGIYTTGTVVTVTANPNLGYTFGSWSGHLSGSVNPTNLTMNGNKGVTANFSVLPPGINSVLLVVGDTTNLVAGNADFVISNRLHTGGYTVQAINDETATAANATGKALVLTSSTVGAGTLGAKFRDVAVPVINWETSVQDDYGFATTFGNTANQTNLNITNPEHPLAGGLLAGVRTVATASGDFSWGEPGGIPIIIARLTSGSTNPCIYAYEAGAAMSSGIAPARRVHLFLQNNTFASANASGLKLFDAAVVWAIGQAAVPPSWVQPPVLQGGQLRLEWVGGTLQTTTNVAGTWSDVSGAVSPYLQPATNPAQFFRVKQ